MGGIDLRHGFTLGILHIDGIQIGQISVHKHRKIGSITLQVGIDPAAHSIVMAFDIFQIQYMCIHSGVNSATAQQ